MIYFILISYLIIVFWGSLFGAKLKDPTPESYFLANRNLNTISLFFTILATNFSAFYFLGFAGEGYKIGLSHYIIMSLGTAFAALSFLIIGPKIWKLGKIHGYITPSELVFGQSQSRSLSVLFSAVMILFTLPYLALQIIGGGYILEQLTQGQLSYHLAVVILTVLTIVYVILGGMESVAKTDLKQGFIVIVFMALAVIWIAIDLGGFSNANQMAYELKPALFEMQGANDFYDRKKWFSLLIFWAFCVPMFPQLFMRFYIAKDVKVLKKSALLYALIPLFISILPVLVGMWGHISFPGLEGKASDQILPMMLVKHAAPWFAALVMTGAIAAFMSTLDSQLLALSTMITRDFILPFKSKKISFADEVKIGRIIVGILAFIGLLIAFNPFATIFDMGKMAFSGLAVLFPVAVAVVHFKIRKISYYFIGIVLSLLCIFLFHYDLIPETWSFGFEPFLIAILISGVFCVFGSTKRIAS